MKFFPVNFTNVIIAEAENNKSKVRYEYTIRNPFPRWTIS